MTFIKTENVNFGYKKSNIIKNVSITFDRFEFVSIIGPNGSGKTTLGKLLMGILTPQSGDIYLDGTPISRLKLSDVGQKIGYLFQNPDRQIFATDVYDELVFAMRFNKIDEKICCEKADKMLKAFDLEHIKNSKCHTLSQGEKQRLAIGTLLLNDPDFLILDEPTTGLDKKRKEELGNILKKLNQSGIGIILISHDMPFVKEHSNRVISLDDGRVVSDEKFGSQN